MSLRWAAGLAGLLLVTLLAGCATRQPALGSAGPSSMLPGAIQRDGPPARRIDVSQIPEPVPRPEPRARFGNQSPYVVLGRTYHVLPSARGYRERGIASWYGRKFHGRPTSSMEPFDMFQFTAAHRTLPLPTYARVTNLETGQSLIVRINDRGPFADNRLIDLSWAAAVRLGIEQRGSGLVEVEAIYPVESGFAAAAPTPVRAAAPLRIFLQAGAFAERRNAEGLKRRLQSAELGPVRIETAAGGRLHRVRIGPLDGVERADAIAARLRALGVDDAHVVIE